MTLRSEEKLSKDDNLGKLEVFKTLKFCRTGFLLRTAVLFKAVEMPTPGWGPRHPPGFSPRGGAWVGKFNIQNPGVWGIFLKIIRDFWEIVL